MNNLDHKKISLLISQKLNETIEIISSERIGGGIHSDGYKLTTGDGQNFFLKEIKPFAAGLEFPERKVMSLLVSHGMYRRFPNLHPQSIGVIIDTKNEATILPELTEQSKIYHLQEFESDSESYWDIIHKRKDKNDIDRKDLEELEKIVGLLVNIHTIKHPSTDTEQLKSVYNDGLRSVITNPELLFVMLTDFPIDDPLLPLKKQGNFVGLMLELLHKFRDRFDRMTALHGDFSGFNVFIKNDGSAWTIDFSRTPWGDPGLDVGWFLFQFLLLYHETGNEYFRKMGEEFLSLYEKRTGDKEVRRAVCLVIGLLGVIFIWPRYYGTRNAEISKKLFSNVLEILKAQEFLWKN